LRILFAQIQEERLAARSDHRLLQQQIRELNQEINRLSERLEAEEERAAQLLHQSEVAENTIHEQRRTMQRLEEVLGWGR
jgi:uncharacterized protein YhaN